MAPPHLATLVIAAALQAGGGGSFGTGGGGGFGGGGDGDGLLWILYWLIRLAIEYPVVGVPLLIVVLVIGAIGTRAGWWKHQERTIRRSRPQRSAHVSRVSAQALTRADPDFDEQRFLERVEKAFLKAQSTWCAQDLTPLRPFVSDGVYERFSLQIEEQRQDGWRQEMVGLRVDRPEIVHVEPGAHFDTVTVRIRSTCEVHRQSLETGKRVRGSTLPREHFSECWSFVRRHGAKSISGDGLMEGACPNCGATLSMNRWARCTHCECHARNGQFDWVLTEITQSSEWRPEREGEVPGLSEYLGRDPGFNVQMLEDHASVAFWRKVAADRMGAVGPLLRVGEDEFARSYGERFTDPARPHLGDCAVGSVRTLGLLPGESLDRAVIEVVWDGRRARFEPDGDLRLDRERILQRTVFVFVRKSGARTSLDTAFSTSRCGSCGAHDPGGLAPTCPYCDSPRTGDAATWMLQEVHPSASSEVRALREELTAAPPVASDARPVKSAADLLTWAAALVLEDHRLTERERRAVVALARRLEHPAELVDALLDGSPNGAAPEARDAQEALRWYRSLTELALEDGSLSRGERAFLASAADRLGIGHRQAVDAMRSARAKLFVESRESRKLAR